MDELLTGWARVIADPAFLDALDAGEAAVIHMFAEILDEWLQSFSPMYKMAVQLCAQVEVGSFDCDGQRVAMRDKVITEILELTGLIMLIREALKLWDRVPAETKKRLRLTLENADTIYDMMNHPDGAIFYKGLVATYKITRNYAEPIIRDVLAGNLDSPAVNGYLRDMSNLEPNNTLRALRYYGLDVEGMTYDKIRDVAKSTFGPVLGETLNLMINPVARIQLAFSVGAPAAKYLGNGLVDISGVVVDLGEQAGEAVVAAKGEILGLVSNTAKAIDGVIEVVGHKVSGGIGAVRDFFGF